MKSLFIIMLTASLLNAATFPEIKGRTLSDDKIIIPSKSETQLLILGFDMNSADAMNSWVKKLNLTPSSSISWVQIPIIGSVPPFVDGFIKGGMKNTVTGNVQDHYFPYFGGKKNDILMSIHGSETLSDKVTPFLVIVVPTANIAFSEQMMATTDNVKTVLSTLTDLTKP